MSNSIYIKTIIANYYICYSIKKNGAPCIDQMANCKHNFGTIAFICIVDSITTGNYNNAIKIISVQ